jgi:hypothetical protein
VTASAGKILFKLDRTTAKRIIAVLRERPADIDTLPWD